MSEPIEPVVLSTPDADTEALTFAPGAAGEGRRLDAFLAENIPGWSRSRLQKVIEDGDVLVNGRPSKPSYKLRAADVLDVELTESQIASFTPEDIPLEILFEDDYVIVVNKPAGLVVHPAAGNPSGTLANALAFHFEQLSRGTGQIRPGIVHRLDRDTSGVMVVAKTDDAHEKLADQFRAREVYKSYTALVHGRVNPTSGVIEQPIARDPKNRTRMAVVRGGRPALSLYKLKDAYERFSRLNVEIKTGRTHQIRVHLAWIKHPVVGDKTYGGGRDNTITSPRLRAALRSLDRQFLHAARIGFRHPHSGEFMKFEAPLPDDLANFLSILEAESGKPAGPTGGSHAQ
jgi:23S rRNA pseudouridine1911/1915/1917 synthase